MESTPIIHTFPTTCLKRIAARDRIDGWKVFFCSMTRAFLSKNFELVENRSEEKDQWVGICREEPFKIENHRPLMRAQEYFQFCFAAPSPHKKDVRFLKNVQFPLNSVRKRATLKKRRTTRLNSFSEWFIDASALRHPVTESSRNESCLYVIFKIKAIPEYR